MKSIVILGSTGSIGRQTLEVVRAFPGAFRVVGLAAGKNREALLEQVREFHPAMVSCREGLERAHLPPGTRVVGLAEMVTAPGVDLVVMALSGGVGLRPTLLALEAGKVVALANKEPLVMAGGLLKQAEASGGGRILPVDSEPSAIWQCLQGEDRAVARLILTASGGPFRSLALEQLARVTPEQALRHPTWRMGPKVTVDSATLMNKAFEVIEAHYLFEVPWEAIEVVIHPQSIVHSMVEFVDGSVKAQLSPPDMRLPIQYALFYPQRVANRDLPRLDPVKVGSLAFEPLDTRRYPCFPLALKAAEQGGTYPAVLSGADEEAVGLFLEGRIGFLDIPRLVGLALERHTPHPSPSLEEVLEAEAWARRLVAREAGAREV